MAAVQPLRTTLLAVFLLLAAGVISYFTPFQRLVGSVLPTTTADAVSCTGTATAWFVPSKHMGYAPAAAQAEQCIQKAAAACAKLQSAFPKRKITFVRYGADGTTERAPGAPPEYAVAQEKTSFSFTENTVVTAYARCLSEPLPTPAKPAVKAKK